jgi:hypothetical protein
MILGSDDALYAVKFQGISGRKGVLNELIGAELMQRMGLPTPGWALINVPEPFLDSQPEGFVFTQDNVRVHPRAGFHFGSKLVLPKEGEMTYQIIPSKWVNRVENRSSFLGALVLDLWTNNCDRRQTVFYGRTTTGTVLRVLFIDNDHMFGGPSQDKTLDIRRTTVMNRLFFRDLWTEQAVGQWMDIVNGISDSEIEQILAKAPKEWIEKTDGERILLQLNCRKRKLMEYLWTAKTELRMS